MEYLFLKLLNMSITASWLVVAVVFLRILLKNAPKAMRCALWGLVGVRLICPFSIESVLSLVPSAQTVPPEILYAQEPAIYSGISVLNQAVNPVISQSLAPVAGASVNPVQILTFAASHLWLVGMMALLLYALVSYLRLRHHLTEATPLRGNIWICDKVDSPFILGLFRPRIYLPSTMPEEQSFFVLAHEQAHLQRKDHWWKPLGLVLLSIYWFNPLLWAAYILLCKDIELACDERVVKNMGGVGKAAYAEALLACSIPRRMIAVCPLAFGEAGVKERVLSVAGYKKPGFWVITLCAAVCVTAAVCFLTDPYDQEASYGGILNRTYRVVEILYEAPQYSFGCTADTVPQYRIAADGVLLERGGLTSGDDWSALGSMREVDYSPAELYGFFDPLYNKARENMDLVHQCWRVDPEDGDTFYLVMQTNHDALLLAVGNAHDGMEYIRWLFDLTGGVSCSVESEGIRLSIYPFYYPEGFDFDYDKLAYGVISNEGSIVFEAHWDTETLVVSEDYYSGEEGVVEKETYTLKRDLQGRFVLPVARRNDVQDEKAVYLIQAGNGVYGLKVLFPLEADAYFDRGQEVPPKKSSTENETILKGDAYVSAACLYMNPLSSTFAGGDSGYRYLFTDNAFVIMDWSTGEVQSVATRFDWAWEAFPYTEAEWSDLFAPGGMGTRQELHDHYDEMLYRQLSERYSLMRMDGTLWLIETRENPQMGKFIWSIYALVPEASMGQAVWEYHSSTTALIGGADEPASVIVSEELTEEKAMAAINHILQTLALHEDGVISFDLPDVLPSDPEGKTQLTITLNLTYSEGIGSYRVESLLDQSTGWQQGGRYTGRWQAQEGEQLVQVMLRAAYMTQTGENTYKTYGANYVQLQAPFRFGAPVLVGVSSASVSRDGDTVQLTFTARDDSVTQLVLVLPETAALLQNEADPHDTFPTLTVLQEGETIGFLALYGYGAPDRETVSAVDPKANRLPMEIYSPIALSNHADYHSGYQVAAFSETGSSALCRMRYQDLSGNDSAAATVEWKEKDCVLAFDLASEPYFFVMTLEPDVLTQQQLLQIAQSIHFQPQT